MKRSTASLFIVLRVSLWLALGWGGAVSAFGQAAPAATVKVVPSGQPAYTSPHQPILVLPPTGSVSATLTAQPFNFTPTTYTWSQVAPASVLTQHLHAAQAKVDLSATNSAQITATFPARGVYQLLLTATDGISSVTAPVWIQVWDHTSGFNPLKRIGRNPGLTPPASVRQLTPDPGPFQHPRLLFTNADWSELNAKTSSSADVISAVSSLQSSLNANFDKSSAPAGALRAYANALVAWADGGFNDAAYSSSVAPVRQFGDRVSFGNDPGGQFPDALLAASYLQWVKVNPSLAQSSVTPSDQSRFLYLAKTAAAAARAELVRVRLGASDPVPPVIASAHDMAVVYDLLYAWMTNAQRTDFRDYLFTIGYGYYNTGTGGVARTQPTRYAVNGDFPNQVDPTTLSALVIEGEESAVTPSVIAATVPVASPATGPAAWPNASPASVWNIYRMARWYSEDRITPWGSPLHHHAYLNFSTGFSGPAMLALARRGQNIFVTSNLYQSSLHAFNNLNPRPSDSSMVLWDHHDSLGFGNGPNVYAGPYLARYMFPDDPLLDFVYPAFRKEISSALLTAMFHVDRTRPAMSAVAQSKALSLTRFDPYRGAGVTRNSWSENDLSLYFECRPDVQGHMHAEANNFSLYALGRAWASPPGYHVTFNEAVSTVLIQNPALAATDTVTDGFVGQSPSSSTTSQTRGQFPTPPGKILEATEDPAGQWTLFAGDATAAYQYAFESGQTAQDTGRRTADFFYGDSLAQLYPGYNPATDTATLKLGNLAFNAVQFAIRSVLTVRGSLPYVLVIDDISADGVTPRNYRWNMSAAVSFGGSGGRFVDANNNDIYSSLRLQSGATATDAILFHLRDAASGPRLLVRDLSPAASGQPAIFIDTRPTNDPRGALTYGYDNNLQQYVNVPTNRLLIPRNNVVKPDYKVLLFPHQSGAALPITSWTNNQTVATIDLRNNFTDRLTFDSTRADKRTRVTRFTRTLSGRSAPSLSLPANLVAPASAATPSFNGQPGAAVTFTITATSDTGATLTPSVSSPSGTVFPVGENIVYVTATDSFGQVESAQFTITVAPVPPSNLTVTPGYTTNTLSWTASGNASGYLVKRSVVPGGPYTLVATVSAGATSYTDTGLITGTTYYYIVTASTNGAETAPTAEASGIPPTGTSVKANNTTALDQPSSWTQAAVPTPPDSASWSGTYSNGTASIGSGLALRGITVATVSTPITIDSGSGNLTLGTGGINLSAATQNLSINAPVILGAEQIWSIASGRTLTLANPILAGTTPAPALTLSGTGTLGFSGTGPANLYSGTISANGTTLRVTQATGNLTLGSANFPSGSTNAFAAITGVGGSRLTLDAPSANLAFASNSAGFTFVLRNGNVTYSPLSGSTDSTSVRVEGGNFTLSPTAARYQLAAANQTFDLLGGTVDVSRVTSFGFRVGGSGSGTQTGAQNVVATQSGGTLLAPFCSIGGSDTIATRSPSYTLSGGVFSVNTTLTIGADTGGNGTSTFAFSGGTLRIPGTLSGGQSGARQIFAMSGGTLAAGTLNFTNLRSTDASANGSFVQSGGTLAPGDIGTAGKTSVTGSYTLGANATLIIDIGGITQATAYQNGTYDTMSVTGNATLAGSLAIRLINAYTPPNASSFTVLSSGVPLSGALGNVAFNQRLSTAGGEGTFLVTKVNNTVALSQYLNALDSWRLSNLGTSSNTGNAANLADPDTDGVPNLLEYALNTNPTDPASAGAPILQVSGLSPQPSFLQLSFLRARSDLTYSVEATSDLTPPASWTTLATNPGNVSPSTPVSVTDTADLAANPRRFLRLRVTAP